MISTRIVTNIFDVIIFGSIVLGATGCSSMKTAKTDQRTMLCCGSIVAPGYRVKEKRHGRPGIDSSSYVDGSITNDDKRIEIDYFTGMAYVEADPRFNWHPNEVIWSKTSRKNGIEEISTLVKNGDHGGPMLFISFPNVCCLNFRADAPTKEKIREIERVMETLRPK